MSARFVARFLQRLDRACEERRAASEVAFELLHRNALRDLHRARFLGGIQERVEREGCGYRVDFVELSNEALP